MLGEATSRYCVNRLAKNIETSETKSIPPNRHRLTKFFRKSRMLFVRDRAPKAFDDIIHNIKIPPVSRNMMKRMREADSISELF